VRPFAARPASGTTTAGRIEIGLRLNCDWKECRLRRLGLSPHGPPDHRDQIDDRQLEDEHQEDDLDHVRPF
jgi:hypothetical protein